MQIPVDLKTSIDACAFVSFDIFDTLILRNVYHFNDVFTFVAELARRRHGIDCPDFPALHVAAEKRAREIAEAKSGSREINLDRLYEVMIEHEGVSLELADRLKQLELEAERRFCRANPFMAEVYEYCLKKGKRIGIVSDMYLPQDFLEAVLSDAGFSAYEFFLLSNSCGKRKRDGSIFPLLIAKAGVAASEILHIGDDRLSDFEMAEKAGLQTWFYRRCREADALYSASLHGEAPAVRNDTAAMAVYNGLRVNRLFCGRPLDEKRLDDDFWYRLGFGKIGLVYLGFVFWLIDELKKDKYDKVFFLSRDGFILKRVYDVISGVESAMPSSEYLCVSRRSLAVALDGGDEARLDLFGGDSERLPLSTYLNRVGINASDYTKRIKEAGFDGPEQVVFQQRDFERLKDLLISLSAESSRLAENQKKLLLRYLEQAGFMNCGKAAVVDIGWQGSMQKSLEKILAEGGSQCVLHGFYVGTFAEARKIGHDEKKLSGWLSDFSYPRHIRKTILRCVPLLEFFFSAPHGSVCSYAESVAGVEPLFSDNVIRKQQNRASEMQRGALDFVADWMRACAGEEWLKPSRDEVFSVLSGILNAPDRLELRRLGDIRHVDSFDGTADARFLARPPLGVALLNLKRLRREYLRSHWKNAFVERLLADSLKLPMSIGKLLKVWGR